MEVQIQTRFKAISAAVQARLANQSTIAADEAAFKAQKDLANGKTTLRSYIWSLESAAYDQAHPGE